jgi:hypothetical protein
MTTEPAPLIEHLESNLGRIESGWNSEERADPAIQVVEFRGGKIAGVTVICTLGLSSFVLESSVTKKQIRQELFIMVKDGQLDSRLPAILDHIARESVRTDRPLLRGEVVEKQNPVLRERNFVALYATLPVYYPDSFWTLQDEDQGDVAFGWLLPIKRKEESYVRQNGWPAFEELLDKAKFDLFDLDRPSLL